MGANSADTIETTSGVQSNTSGLDGISAVYAAADGFSGTGTASAMQDSARSMLANVDSALTELN
jgi:hypothetical protein